MKINIEKYNIISNFDFFFSPTCSSS